MLKQNKNILKKIPFQHFVIIKKASVQKRHISTWEVERNTMANIFPSDPVVAQGLSMLRQYTSFYWLTNTVSASILSSQD